jgi:hypothetical protein
VRGRARRRQVIRGRDATPDAGLRHRAVKTSGWREGLEFQSLLRHILHK